MNLRYIIITDVPVKCICYYNMACLILVFVLFAVVLVDGHYNKKKKKQCGFGLACCNFTWCACALTCYSLKIILQKNIVMGSGCTCLCLCSLLSPPPLVVNNANNLTSPTHLTEFFQQTLSHSNISISTINRPAGHSYTQPCIQTKQSRGKHTGSKRWCSTSTAQ